ncbi:MAG: glycosyltransferase family 4 protein [Magnetococcus sp. YQC-3]
MEHTPAQRKPILLIEGYRYHMNSFSACARNFSLSILKRGVIDLRFLDGNPEHSWAQDAFDQGLYDTYKDSPLGRLQGMQEGEQPDVVLRMDVPMRIGPPFKGKTFLFGACDMQTFTADQFAEPFSAQAVQSETRLHVMTFSTWSATGFLKVGFPQERVHVVPLGFDPELFRPDEQSRRATRQRLGFRDEDIVFLTVGGCIPAEGTGMLLQAFLRVAADNPHARLLIKGLESVYRSTDRLNIHLAKMAEADRKLLRERTLYLGGNLPDKQMPLIFQAGDLFVSPYIGEGFNIPVLEAAATGLPIICTQGGPTDEFTEPSYALRINSKLKHIQGYTVLDPDAEHLFELMSRAASDPEWRQQAGQLATQDAHNRFTWDKVTERLVQRMFSAT